MQEWLDLRLRTAYLVGMPRSAAQLNIRSSFARERTAALVRQTGMTATQVVEEALRAYLPPDDAVPGHLIRKGALLVHPGNGRRISLAEANAELEAARAERG